ncbi:MAG TPA: L,D-transpeptidase family protein [Methylovirgula sp.]|nr:L,D-transpeptidase family protein [Methylovirgula sp.]
MSRSFRWVLPAAVLSCSFGAVRAQSVREVIWSGSGNEPAAEAVTEIYATKPAASALRFAKLSHTDQRRGPVAVLASRSEDLVPQSPDTPLVTKMSALAPPPAEVSRAKEMSALSLPPAPTEAPLPSATIEASPSREEGAPQVFAGIAAQAPVLSSAASAAALAPGSEPDLAPLSPALDSGALLAPKMSALAPPPAEVSLAKEVPTLSLPPAPIEAARPSATIEASPSGEERAAQVFAVAAESAELSPPAPAAAPALATPAAAVETAAADHLEPPQAPDAAMPTGDIPATPPSDRAPDSLPPQDPLGSQAPAPTPPDAAARPAPTAPAPAANAPAPAVPQNAAPAAQPSTPPPAAGALQPPAKPVLSAAANFVKQAVDALVATRAEGSEAAELHKERAAIAAYYAARDYEPLWIEDGKPVPAVSAVMDRLAHAADDGLDLAGLVAPVFSGGLDKLAAADVALSAQVVIYGRQASGSRVDPGSISNLIGAKPDLPDPALILAAVVAAGSEGADLLESFNPPQKQYQDLRAKLAELRASKADSASLTIPNGKSLRVGMSDPRVPLIRARFGLDAGADDADLYDSGVAAAVADYQRANGLPASGVLTGRTVESLSRPARLEHEILANMELWRWMPRDLGASRIEVNIPDFSVTVVQDGQVVLHNRVIVGKPDSPTPVFSNTMKFLIVNPYWNVPPSIVRKEMLPKVAGDPYYLSEMGFQVFSRHGQLFVRQPPGDDNALGHIKFMFPNQYSVYLHDTPSRHLFSAARRAFSHGCVRVDQPFEFAETVLGPEWPQKRLKRLLGSEEHYVYLPKPLPIHIEYFTAYVDDGGELQVRDDVYGYVRKVEAALGLEKPEPADEVRTSQEVDADRTSPGEQDRLPAGRPHRSQANRQYWSDPSQDQPLIAGHP